LTNIKTAELRVFLGARHTWRSVYFDNPLYIIPPLFERLEYGLPAVFTQDTRMNFHSAIFQTFFVINTGGTYSFRVKMSSDTSVVVHFDQKNVTLTNTPICRTGFITGTHCCGDQEVEYNITMTTGQAIQFQIDFIHLTGYPCVMMEYYLDSVYKGHVNEDNIYAPVELFVSRFKIESYLNPLMIDYALSTFTILPHTNPNTLEKISLIQVGELSLIQLNLVDIYGNHFDTRSDVLFILETINKDGVTKLFKSYFNESLSSNVIDVDLILSGETQFTIRESITGTVL
jgi:hypothetical protein